LKLTDAQIEKLRQSGIRLDAEGRFWHEGQEVTHHGLRAAFFRWLDRNPDGKYVLRLDENRFVYLDVDDAPFVIRTLRWEGDQPIALLSDGSEEALACGTLRLEGERAYATVKNKLPARVSSSAWAVLAERVTTRDGAYWLDAAGGPYRLGPA
jgi:hypothetical protein